MAHEMNRKLKLCIINPLLKICNILSILPPHTIGEDPKEVPKSFKYYTLLLIIFVAISYVYSVYGKLTHLQAEFEPALLFIDIVGNITLTTTNIITMIIIVFKNHHNVKLFLNKFEIIDDYLRTECPKAKRNFWITMMVFNFATWFAIILDAVVWLTSVGMTWFQYYLVRNLQFYHFSVTVFLVFLMAQFIKVRYSTFNKLLQNTVRGINEDDYCKNDDFKSKPIGYAPRYRYQELKDLRRYYNILSDMVVLFNTIFGFILLFCVLFIIIILINYIILFIIYNIKKNTLGEVQMGLNLMLLTAVWCIVVMILTVLLAASCDALAVEARKTSSICYILLDDVPTLAKTDRDRFVKEELVLLSHQVACRAPCISAAGFFVVNYSMLGFIMATITSYIIVSVQFVRK